MSGVLGFLKKTAIWASVWAALFLGLSISKDIGAGRSLDLLDPWTWVAFVTVWVVIFCVTALARLVWGARRFGFRLGKEAVSNPAADAGGAVRRAAGLPDKPPSSKSAP